MHRCSLVLAAAAALACDGGTPRQADRPEPATAGEAAAVVPVSTTSPPDMPASVESALVRFRNRVGPDPAGLSEAAAPDRDALVARYVRALEEADTAALAPMSVSAAEFVWLYYPHSPYVRPPRALDADIAWLLIAENSRKGAVRALREYGGRPLGFTGYRCDAEPVVAGPNRLWQGCVLDVRLDGAAAAMRFFATILEHGGRFKFLSYANDL